MPPQVPDSFFEQSGVIPFRINGEVIEVLLITSLRGRWIVPKGVIEPDLTPAESAAEEAYEEAGVRGRVFDRVVGEFQKAKWGGVCNIVLFPLEVTEVLSNWPEKRDRERKWFLLDECHGVVSNPDLREVLQRFAEDFDSFQQIVE